MEILRFSSYFVESSGTYLRGIFQFSEIVKLPKYKSFVVEFLDIGFNSRHLLVTDQVPLFDLDSIKPRYNMYVGQTKFNLTGVALLCGKIQRLTRLLPPKGS